MRPHLCLDVWDISTAVECYQKIFGLAAQKQAAGYVKFDLARPALNLSLVSFLSQV
jgi:extradiol dioxygenase family protein